MTSDALDPQGRKRGFRYVIFDLFGHTVDRPDLEHAYSSSARATKEMWNALNKMDAKAITLAAIEREELAQFAEMNTLRATVMAPPRKKASAA